MDPQNSNSSNQWIPTEAEVAAFCGDGYFNNFQDIRGDDAGRSPSLPYAAVGPGFSFTPSSMDVRDDTASFGSGGFPGVTPNVHTGSIQSGIPRPAARTKGFLIPPREAQKIAEFLGDFNRHREAVKSDPGAGLFPTIQDCLKPPLDEDAPMDRFLAYVSRLSPKETPPPVSGWNLKQNGFTAIRGRPGNSQRYVGAQKIYEYILHDGNKKTKTDWLMYELYLFDPHPDGSSRLVIDEDMVLRVICRSDRFPDAARTQPTCSNTAESGQAPPAKRRKSAAWENVTEIYSKDNKLMYAVCNCCDKILNAETEKHGTTSIKRHQKTCSRATGASTSSQPQSSGLSVTA